MAEGRGRGGNLGFPTTITKSKIYTITSRNSTKLNGTMNSNINIPLPNLINKSDNVINIWFSILHAEIPNSFYLVNSFNNTLIINGITYTIPVGNYNATTLLNVMTSLVSGLIITYSSSLLKYTFSYTAPFNISKNSTILRIIGGDPNNDISSVGNSLTLPYTVNFLPIPRILFRSRQLTFNNFNQGDNSNDLFLSVQNGGNLGSMIFYNNFSQLRFLYEGDITSLGVLEIRVSDDFNNLLDMNNQDWFITFQVDIEFIPTEGDTSFSEIVKPPVLPIPLPKQNPLEHFGIV